MDEKLPKVTILGAGLSGLSFAYHYPGQSIIYEKSDKIGGTASTENYEGFFFDHGPHVSFTKDNYVRDLLEKNTKVVYKIAKPMNIMKGMEFPHPALFHLNRLPKEERYKILKDYVEAYRNYSAKSNPRNYGEWCEINQGKYFAGYYTESYTKKFWQNSSENLTTEWTNVRIPIPSIDDAIKGVVGLNNKSGYYFNEYWYPKKGGFGSFSYFWIKRKRDIQIHLGKEVKIINPSKKVIGFSDGSEQEYFKLVSTIPIPELSNILIDIPRDIRNSISKLETTSLHYINLGLKGKWKRKFSWLYFYDEDIPVTRMIPMNNIGPNMSPDGFTSLQIEIPYTKRFENKLAHISLEKLMKLNYLRDSDIYKMWEFDLEYGYPIYNKDRGENLKKVLEYLKEIEIVPVGRYGTWSYLWSHQVILQGREKAIEMAKNLKKKMGRF